MSMERASGGHSWADAVFRKNASNKAYIEAMLDQTQRIEKTIHVQPEKRIEAFFGVEGFILVYESRIVLHKSYHYVDCCRAKSPFDFEQELERLVQTIRKEEDPTPK